MSPPSRAASCRRTLETARRLSGQGRLRETVGLLTRALARAGPHAGLYSCRAQTNFHYRHYDEALADATRAIALSPRDPALYSLRADILAQVNRPGPARRDLERALSLSPADEWLRYARLRLLIFCGRYARARREISRLLESGSPGPGLEGVFYRGCLNLKAGRAALAARDFRRILDSTGPLDNRSLRARLYWLLARSRQPAMRRRYFGSNGSAKGPRLYLCGLGLFPPYTATLDVLAAISRCDVLVNNVSGVETREFLSLLCPKVRPATYDNHGDDQFWVRRIEAELRRGRVVAFVTRGHPLVFGGLGEALVRRCESLAIPCETFGAVSSIDALMSAAGGLSRSPIEGVQAYDHKVVVVNGEPVDPRHPMLLYLCEGRLAGREVERVALTLRRFYPADHPCWMYGPTYDRAPEAFRLEELSRAFPSIHPSQILYLPAVDGRRPHG